MNLHDRDSERTVLGGILWHAELVFPALAKIGFKPDCFTTHWHQLVWAELYEMWVNFEKINLCSAFDKLKKFRQDCPPDDRFVGNEIALWLAGTDSVSRAWPIDLQEAGKWWYEEHDSEPLWVMLAMSAARKVQWLASRRHAIHRAKELLRDAENGSGDPQYFDSQM